MKKRIWLIALLFIGNSSSKADTLYLHLDSFLNQISRYHPLAQVANLQIAKGNAEFLKAKGSFDPTIYGAYDIKEFDNKRYFENVNSGLNIPLWPGLDMKFGYEANDGELLNPERYTPQGGLVQLGLNLNLLQGLITDARRTAYKKAELGLQVAENERISQLNQLFADASYLYIQWQQTWQELLLYEKVMGIAQQRYNAVKQLYLLGDKPSIDTLEAYIQLQNRQVSLQNANIKFTTLGFYMQYYLWNESREWTMSKDFYLPSGSQVMPVLVSESSLPDFQPDLNILSLKYESLLMDQRLKKEMLKPSLKVSYNALNKGFTDITINNNDYKFGASFNMPILLRKERGDLKLVQLYLMETELKLNQKRVELDNKLRSISNELIQLEKQVRLQEDIVRNTLALFEGEQIRFAQGESSLFVVNGREQAYIQSTMALLDARLKLGIAVTKYHQIMANWPAISR